MVILHGFSFSNYYNIVKHVLMHKGIPFEEDLQWGDAEAYLAISPLGKVPAITTEQGGHLSESSVCCDYLEENYPDVPLYPSDSFTRNYVRQIMKISELYLELPCRRLIPFVFQDIEAPQALQDEVRAMVERGIGAMNRLCEFEPYITGSDLTMADIYVRYVMSVVGLTAGSKMGWDIAAEIEGMTSWLELMGDSDISRKIDADQQANGPEFMAHLQERLAS